ncbi:MAG: hypothetical protein CMJ45_10235 [Planctomyces sp.]|jgi:hypothetical protein|nr:hypothetical protein [Planctomyces sp.]|tara:strand:+ start:433 stop:663 length:231 start_codon:yes stop_codon:yes gene_type:complete
MALDLKVGDVVRMKKAHPCGNHLWLVTRLGADIGITCEKCRRHVMLARSLMERRVKEVIPHIRELQDSGDAVIYGS